VAKLLACNKRGREAAIRTLVSHRTADYDIDRIENPQLRTFVRQMQGG
jgi:hypothetical protein